MRLSCIPLQPTDARPSTSDTRKNRRPSAVRPSLFALLALLAGCTSPKLPWGDIEKDSPDPQTAAAEQLFKDGQLLKFLVASYLPGENAKAQTGLDELKKRCANKLSPELLKAEKLFEKGNKQAAIQACEEIAKKSPDAVGLPELRARITRNLSPEVAAAEALFEQGKTQEAIIACIDIASKKGNPVGLADLQSRITLRLAHERMADSEKRSEATLELHTADAKRFAVSPETYRQRKHVVGENTPTLTPLTEMQKVLMQPIDLELVNADVNAIIAEIKKSTNVNYIADSDIVSTKKITARFEKTPLIEMLGYFDKNLDINFSVCSNLIWITQKEAPSLGVPPMQTRVYRLRKGLVGSELGKSASGKSLFKGPEERGRGNSLDIPKEQKGNEGKIGLLDSIDRFVPQPEGSDFLFNDKIHALIVKNTRENLELVESLIEALDIRPLQVLIEARFVTTKIGDLRELGIDWLFRKPSLDRTGQYDKYTLEKLQQVQQNMANDITNPEVDFDYTDLITIGERIKELAPQEILRDSGEIAVGAAGTSGYYQTLLGSSGFQATLKALQSRNDTRTIIVPRVTTLNNREASFRFGEDVSYFENVNANIMTSGGYGSANNNSRDNVTYDYETPTIVEVGYALSVTPSVGADLSTINMVLRPEISKIKDWAVYKLGNYGATPTKSGTWSADNETAEDPAIKLPVISRQYIETEAVVRSGETIVLGGLVDTAKKIEEQGTPFLSDLPLIGWLFKTKVNQEENNNILIFVTATLISDVGEELIPLNELERYGVAVPKGADVPNVLKEAAVNATPAPAPEAPKPAAPVAAAPAPAAAP